MTEWEPFKARGIHICHLNVRSLWNKLEVIKQQLKGSKVSIFTVSETWLNPDITNDMLYIKGYNLLRLDRSWCNPGNRKRKKGGVLCVYVKEGICFSATEFEYLNVSSIDIECQWVSINRPNERKIIVVNTYRCPGGDPRLFTEYLSDKISGVLIGTNYDMFLLGDMNIDYLKNKSGCKKS